MRGEPDRIAAELAADEAVRAADTVLFTVPNQLGLNYNARILAPIADRGVTVARPSRTAPVAALTRRARLADVDCAVVVPNASLSVWRTGHEH